jgi:hypothetical protein
VSRAFQVSLPIILQSGHLKSTSDRLWTFKIPHWIHSLAFRHLKATLDELGTFRTAYHKIYSHWSGVFPGSSLPSPFGNVFYIELVEHFGLLWGSFYLPFSVSARLSACSCLTLQCLSNTSPTFSLHKSRIVLYN